MYKIGLYYEAAVALMLLSCFHTNGINVEIYNEYDCGGEYDLDEYGSVTIKFHAAGLSGECRITVKEPTELPRMCIKPSKLTCKGVSVTAEVHKGYVLEGYEDETYTCNGRTTDESCTYLSTITVFFEVARREIGIIPVVDFTISVYPKESEYSSNYEGVSSNVGLIIGITIGASVLVVIICITAIICSRLKRSNTPVFTNQQVQYGMTPQVVGYNSNSNREGQPLQPPVASYQPPPSQENQSSQPQEYRYPTAYVYQPSAQGNQVQGYSAPPAPRAVDSTEHQPAPSAPLPDQFSVPPPPYPGN